MIPLRGAVRACLQTKGKVSASSMTTNFQNRSDGDHKVILQPRAIVFTVLLGYTRRVPTVSPCPRCGDTRAEPVYRSVYYSLLRRLGYRLCECGRCRRWRVFRRHHQGHRRDSRRDTHEARTGALAVPDRSANSPEAPAVENPSVTTATMVETETTPADAAGGPRIACPFCGSENCRPSRRTFWERWIGRPKMLRRRLCRKRFPRPPLD